MKIKKPSIRGRCADCFKDARGRLGRTFYEVREFGCGDPDRIVAERPYKKIRLCRLCAMWEPKGEHDLIVY